MRRFTGWWLRAGQFVMMWVLAPVPGHPTAQIRQFQGEWESRSSETRPGRRLLISNLDVRITEPCPDAPARACTYRTVARVHQADTRAGGDAATALVMDYRAGGAVKFSVITWSRNLLLVETFTRSLTDPVRGPTVESLEYRRPRREMARRAPPRPAPDTVFSPERPRDQPTLPAQAPELPQFPWPPPAPTSFRTLPAGLVTSGPGDSLGLIFDRLKQALLSIEGEQWSVYAIGQDGFAVVTKLEAIEPDGRPKPLPDRWMAPSDRVPSRITGIADYLRALLFARPGRYRFLVLAVTGLPISGSSTTLTATRATQLLRSGEDRMPESFRARTLGPSGRCVALIYEFERASDVSEPRFLESSPVSVSSHLIRAGLWTVGQLRR